ncbi:nocturnin-like isoform X1 [Conger conger]|uniref:nocturnin-like isoform X1 n=2 Tax=Conger conger TaxID=82655 RepID=UPI002A5A01EC|nr:nocturnin-like isoform X1 [Conger conger]
MYQGPGRVSLALLQGNIPPVLRVSVLRLPVEQSAGAKSLSPSLKSLYCDSACVENPKITPVASKAAPASGSVGSRNVCSMGSSSSRLYSALAQTLSGGPTAQEGALEQDLGQEPERCDPDQLQRECQEVLRQRPPRTQRCFTSPRGPAPQGLSPGQPIRVMQWNILAQALGEGKDSFVRCPPEALNWAERKYLILEEILTYRPDILCLQEVDHYYDTFQPVLQSLGYHGTFCPKPWSPCLDLERNNGPDGCALFFRRERFQLEHSASVRLAAALLKTNQVAIIQTLRCRATGRALCVAVTHLKARSGWERLRSAQGSDLLRYLQTASGGRQGVPLLVCGDFNAEPSEDVYRRFAASGLELDSAYTRLSPDGAEPPYTTWKIRPSGESCHTLDYIWFSRLAFRVESLLELPTAEQIGPDRLPSYNYPSDHLSLICDFSLLDPAQPGEQS